MRTIFFFIYFFISTNTYSQESYRAIYDCAVINNLKESEAILKQYPSYNTAQSKISYDFVDSLVTKSDSTIPDIAIQNYFLSLRNAYANNLSLVYLCSDDIIRKEKLIKNKDFISSSTLFNMEYIDTTNTSTITYLNVPKMKIIKYNYNEASNKRSATCFNIDTIDLYFIPTGNSKKINSWLCKEYKCKSNKYNDIAIWASTEIHSSITPQVILNNVKGGIVSIEFANNSSVTLRRIYTEHSKIIIPDCDTESNSGYDMLNFYIRDL